MTGPSAGSGRAPGRRGAWFLVGVLLLLYVFSFIDRTILTLLVNPIRADLKISDFQMGLLLGPAFALFYVTCGLFMGQLVDRYPRRFVVALGVGTWGSATALGGIASSYLALAASRMGVGVGESVLTPAAHAIIAENFPPHKLSRAIAVYSTGVIIGSSISLAIGGAVVQFVGNSARTLPILGTVAPWNVVLLFVGLATLAMMPVIWLLPNNKPGGRSHGGKAVAEQIEFGPFLRRHWRVFVLLPVGFGCTNIVVSATFAWIPTLLDRSHGWTPTQIGSVIASQHIIFGLIGQMGASTLADRLFARGVLDAHTRIHVYGLIVSIPLLALALVSNSPWWLMALSSPFILLSFPFLGYANAALQILTPPSLRGRVSAFFLATVTAIGTLLGAPTIGFLSDRGIGAGGGLGTPLALVSLIGGAAAAMILWYVGKSLQNAHESAGVTAQ